MKQALKNGYTIDNIIVKKLKVRVMNCEVYVLENNKFLYLFLDIDANTINNSSKEVSIIDVGLNEYVGVLEDEYDVGKVPKIKKELTNTFGFSAVAGMKELKALLVQEVLGPLREPEKYKKYKLSIPNGVLLFGPPGCGKTFISRKLAEEIGYNFYEIKHSDIASPYIHGSTGKIGKVFKEAKKNSPSIVFFDEISSIVPKREGLDGNSSYKEEEVNEFLINLNDAEKNKVLVIGATNFPDKIDDAIMRSGRLDKRIYVGLPDFEARKALFKMYLKDRPVKNIDFNKLAKITKSREAKIVDKKLGFQGEKDKNNEVTHYYVASDIELLCDNFARKALNSGDAITMELCKKVIRPFMPSITKESLDFYHKFVESYQRI